MRSLLNLCGHLVGVVGGLVFCLSVLAALASPAASGVPGPCAAPAGSLFSPCADLDASQVDDLRAPVLVGDPASSVYRCLLAAGFRTVDEVGSYVEVPARALPVCGVRP